MRSIRLLEGPLGVDLTDRTFQSDLGNDAHDLGQESITKIGQILGTTSRTRTFAFLLEIGETTNPIGSIKGGSVLNKGEPCEETGNRICNLNSSSVGISEQEKIPSEQATTKHSSKFWLRGTSTEIQTESLFRSVCVKTRDSSRSYLKAPRRETSLFCAH